MLDRPSDLDDFEFSPDPHVTRHDVLTALGPDADSLMSEADIDVDELIQLINAETTMLPPIVIPDEASADRTAEAKEEPEDGLATAVKTWKKRFLKGAVLAVMITLTGGGAAALAMNKSVTLDVDGERQTVRSFGGTVGEVLEDAGITVGAHDALSPSPQAAVGDGGVITLERGRQLNLIVDGEQREAWVRATTVGEALEQLGLQDLNQKGTWFSTPVGGEVPLDGMTLEVKTLKNITLFDGGNQPRELSTTAVTAEELLKELNLSLGPKDKIEGGLEFKIRDGASVHISRTGVSVINETEVIEPEVRTIEDPELEQGTEIVEEEGVPGEEIVTYRITKENDREIAREELSSKIIKAAKDRVIRVGTKEPPQPVISDGAVWDALAQCESTGNWAINTGNGYYGGLQFDKSTWDAYGGDQYAAYPHEATREQQIAIATKVRDDRGGYSAWPSCQSQLGLP
ncbi:resuscitation-promoting factor [Prauserella flavalba]|uniref:Transglycosylase n=1 Tax=Prauserella flavalba TaxID=1477506 RepID=A0A318LEM4_9PSEU|nr:resuscitation-promoting factor [Prauserella flavalba]PXY20636.1 transglycosylase [Prauserella flavalba]